MKYKDLLIETRILNINFYLSLWTLNNLTLDNFIRKLIKDAIKDKSNTSKIPNNLLIDDWDRKDYAKGTLVEFKPSRETLIKFDLIFKWLKDLPKNEYQLLRGIQTLDIAFNLAQKYFKEKERREEENILKGEKVVFTFDDGMKIIKLGHPDCFEKEGKLMQNCLANNYSSYYGNTNIFSLRDKQNKPHANIEEKEGVVKQIKGKQNDPPKDRYIPYIRKFIFDKKFDIQSNIENINLIKLNNKFYDIYSLDTWPKEIQGNLDLCFSKIEYLPENIIVHGNFNLYQSKIKELPENLQVFGYLNLRETKINKLPSNLYVKEYLNIQQTEIKMLPKTIKIDGIIYSSKKLKNSEFFPNFDLIE